MLEEMDREDMYVLYAYHNMIKTIYMCLVMSFIILAGCAPQSSTSSNETGSKVNLVTSTVYTPIQVMQTLGDMGVLARLHSSTYHQVNHAAIEGLLVEYRHHLFDDGINTTTNGWDARFNCTSFTHYLLGFAATKYMVQSWGSWRANDADKLALFSLIYMTDSSAARNVNETHNIVIFITEKGVEYWEPQPGGSGQVQLSNGEKLSAREISD